MEFGYRRPKSIARAISGLFTVLVVSGCGLNGPAHKPAAPSVAAVIDLGFMSYSPDNITICPGDTVEWRNTSLITHTVTDDTRRAKKQGDASLPSGAQAFDSGDIPAGQIYLHTFTIPGTYHYFCTYHANHGMVGTIIVKPAS